MRSVFAIAAALWFIANALWFMPEGGAYYNPGSPTGIDGDPGAVAVVWASLRSLLDWRSLV